MLYSFVVTCIVLNGLGQPDYRGKKALQHLEV